MAMGTMNPACRTAAANRDPGAAAFPAARTTLRRRAYAAVGVTLVGVGAVGVFVPGLPTTVWLMGASYCFARSNPRLETKLIRNRFFGPYLRYLDRPAFMPRRAKFAATGLMWTSVGLSLTMTATAGRLTWWLGGGIVAAAAVGTWCIWTLGRADRSNGSGSSVRKGFDHGRG